LEAFSRIVIGVAASKGAEKPTIDVILSEAKNLAFFVFPPLLNRREILRFAQNDRIKHFFRSLFTRDVQGGRPIRLSIPKKIGNAIVYAYACIRLNPTLWKYEADV
jgi:hypothetical protein